MIILLRKMKVGPLRKFREKTSDTVLSGVSHSRAGRYTRFRCSVLSNPVLLLISHRR